MVTWQVWFHTFKEMRSSCALMRVGVKSRLEWPKLFLAQAVRDPWRMGALIMTWGRERTSEQDWFNQQYTQLAQRTFFKLWVNLWIRLLKICIRIHNVVCSAVTVIPLPPKDHFQAYKSFMAHLGIFLNKK